MIDQNTTKPKHFLDSIDEFTEDTSIVTKTTDNKVSVLDNEEQNIDEDQLSEEELEALEEEKLRLEQEENDNNGEDTDTEQDEESNVVSFAPFLQELVEGDILIVPENKEYDDDINGFKELIDDNVLLKHEAFKENLINPTSLKFLEFLEAGGSPDEYIDKASSIPDYAAMDLEDENTLKNLIADHLHIQGYDSEDIDSQLSEFEEIGSLAKHGAIAQKYLIKYAEKELVNITKQQQIAEEQRVANLQKESEELRDTIYKTETIGGFKLTKTQRDQLYDYITKPVKKENGKIYTQNLIDDSNETKVALAYYKMKKFNFKDIENKVETKKASELQNQLRKRSDKLLGKNNVTDDREENNTVRGVLKGWDFLSRD